MPVPLPASENELFEALFALTSPCALYSPVRSSAGTLLDFRLGRSNPAAERLMPLLSSGMLSSLWQGEPAGTTQKTLADLHAAYEAMEPLPLLACCSAAPGANPTVRATAQRVGDELLVSFSTVEAPLDEKLTPTAPELASEAQQHYHLQQMLALAPVAVARLSGPEHIFTFLNPAYAQLLGGRPVLGLPVREALPDLNNQAFPGLLDQVYQTGQPFVGQQMLVQYDRTHSGRIEDTYFNFVYQATRNPKGQITGVILFAHEVTDVVRARLQAQRLNVELQQANQQLEARVLARTQELEQARAQTEIQGQQLAEVFAQAPVAICVFRGPRYVVEVVNPLMHEMLARPLQELIGRPFAEALPDLAQQGLPDVLAQVWQTGQPYVAQERELRLQQHGDGPPGYYTFTYQPIRDEQGQVTAIACVAVDVTGLVEARRRVEHSERRFRQLAETTPMVVWEADAQGHTTYLSPRWEQFTTAASGLGLGWQEYIHPDDQEPFLQAWLAAVRQGTPFQAEVRLRVAATGQYRWHLDRAEPVRTAEGEMLQWVGAATDVHEQKQTELELQVVAHQLRQARDEAQHLNQQLRLTNQQLVRTNADLDNFIYTASHDLRAPITNIEGLLTLLREQLDAAAMDQVPELLAMMQGAVERFQLTITQLSDIVQLQQAHTPPSETVDLAALIEAVRLDLVPLLTSAGAHLEVEISRCPTLSFPPKNLRSILYNLLSNAVKYRHPDRAPMVYLRTYRTDSGQAVLTVQDNGLGLTTTQQQKLFGMFQRLHTHVDGSGIGLYMVKKILETAGGQIEVESQPGIGTTFTVTFPL